MSTDLAPSPHRTDQVLSSKDDISAAGHHSIDKRFLFLNKNQFVASTTLTTYSVTSVVKTVTVNLLNPGPAVACEAVDLAALNPQCVACLPSGFTVCAATG